MLLYVFSILVSMPDPHFADLAYLITVWYIDFLAVFFVFISVRKRLFLDSDAEELSKTGIRPLAVWMFLYFSFLSVFYAIIISLPLHYLLPSLSGFEKGMVAYFSFAIIFGLLFLYYVRREQLKNRG
ncbi:MAG: hypothetical protein V1676_07385 [Candidatus Diapherotrites archaeon]